MAACPRNGPRDNVLSWAGGRVARATRPRLRSLGRNLGDDCSGVIVKCGQHSEGKGIEMRGKAILRPFRIRVTMFIGPLIMLGFATPVPIGLANPSLPHRITWSANESASLCPLAASASDLPLSPPMNPSADKRTNTGAKAPTALPPTAGPLSQPAALLPHVTQECLPWRLVSGISPGVVANWLFGVASITANNAWAVGGYWDASGGGTLIVHWNGENWSQIPSPNDTYNNVLYGIAAATSNDVWAVGYHGYPFQEHMLILHWDGTSWQLIKSPTAETADYLYGVVALAANNVWAVGYSAIYSAPMSTMSTLIMHWDGTQWSIVPSPNASPYDALRSITAVAANDIWAVGTTLTASNVKETLVLHWDGVSWKRIPSPSPGKSYNDLYAVVSTRPDDIWAVGDYGSDPAPTKTLILHWDGLSWQVIPSPNIGNTNNSLYGIAPIASGNIWAVGAYGTDVGTLERVLTLHWNGSQWETTNNPNVGTAQNRLDAIAANSSGELWTVGYYANPGLIKPAQTLIEHHLDPCTPCTINFSDVRTTDYFFGAVQYLYCRSIISGYSTNAFRPWSNVTRAQLSKIIVLAENWPIYIPSPPSFADVPMDNGFYPYVETAYYHSIISGYSDHSFRPSNSVTRGQASKMIVNASGWQIDTTGGPHFYDVPRDGVFYPYIETAFKNGVVTGYSDHTFRPNAGVTRGQVAIIVYRAIALLLHLDADKSTPPF